MLQFWIGAPSVTGVNPVNYNAAINVDTAHTPATTNWPTNIVLATNNFTYLTYVVPAAGDGLEHFIILTGGVMAPTRLLQTQATSLTSVQVFTITVRKNELAFKKLADFFRTKYINYFYIKNTANVTLSSDGTVSGITIDKMLATNKLIVESPPTLTIAEDTP